MRDPDFIGRYSGWKLEVPSDDEATMARAVVELIRPARSTIVTWLVKEEDNLYTIHLRHLRDMKKPLRLEWATHQIVIHAVDQAAPVEKIVDYGGSVMPYLVEPRIFAAQFVAASDRVASDRVYLSVCDVCCGDLSPDAMYLNQWIARFGDNMMR